ncbi:MAG TPA: class I SAM-dependent methyltransferase [Candidatus Sulfopaludibacter sp.]|nr:class I SAM-dependent methyltransferase [Candidatus Sulfopaludibacter sp.]
MLDAIQYRILKRISPVEPGPGTESAYAKRSKLSVLMGDSFFGAIAGKVVIDFGCGEGDEAIEMAKSGAARVIGIDIRTDVLQTARRKAVAAGVGDVCQFGSSAAESADVIVSLDAFEHFQQPAEILRTMSSLLKPGGQVLVSFGPTWYHPLGGHLFSVFPWAHLIFSERALIRWRSDFKTDGATKFSEVAGGLNRMTIARFEAIVGDSPLKFASLELVAIRKLSRFHNQLTREFFTAIVRCCLVKRA